MASKKRTLAYFISDAHLGTRLTGFDQRETELPAFLRELTDTASHLFIVGDLFDFWIEYAHAVRPVFFPVLHELRLLVEHGVEVHYLAGNHDFALGSFLNQAIGIHLHPAHLDIELQGKKVHLYHGDGLLRRDVGYRLLRRILRNRFNQRLYKLLHPNIGVPLALFFSRSSRHYMESSAQKIPLDEYRGWARQRLDAGSDIVVLGHTHHPEISDYGGRRYCNTGEWIRRYTYACMENGEITLWRRIPGAAPMPIQFSATK
ncbi:MAG: UDP-2,3-diacylglucosamine diphosphatase [Chitinivibrionales bacterium]|nr:UDP-2,3-diacylglucosamine diphosphatase [Chitinivibrionales bacterium]MBD3356293.1 UDP-2,3-diacylglucosamine diphosphatase [Chitinivibrionales bacterium]